MVEVALLGYGYIMDAVSSKRAEQGRKINKDGARHSELQKDLYRK